MVVGLVSLPVVGVFVPTIIAGGCDNQIYVITAKMCLERTNSQFSVRSPSIPSIVEQVSLRMSTPRMSTPKMSIDKTF